MQISDDMVRAALDEYGIDEHTNDTDAMRAALEAALSAMWQDISTAPKDGERILLGWRGEMSAEGFWHDGSKNHWGKAGWFFADDDLLTGRPCGPDCWIPLTPPPKGVTGV